MPSLELFFTIEGEDQLIRRLNDVERDFKDFMPEFKKTGEMLLKTFRLNFQSQGRLLGEPWAPLKPETLEQKRRQGFPSDILVRSGRLRSSFEASPSKFQVVISNAMSYFVYHQSRKPRHKLPRRIMMKIDNMRKELIVKIFQIAVQDKLQKRGFIK